MKAGSAGVAEAVDTRIVARRYGVSFLIDSFSERGEVRQFHCSCSTCLGEVLRRPQVP
jgi:hypothetical protein